MPSSVPPQGEPSDIAARFAKDGYVFPVDVSVEDAMRSIISCGAGSSSLISQLNKKQRAAIKGASDIR